MVLVLRRTAIFIVFVMALALLAAAMAHSATRDGREIVAFSGFAPGTIVVKTDERRLYYVIDNPGPAWRRSKENTCGPPGSRPTKSAATIPICRK
jgi:hypothetical protein